MTGTAKPEFSRQLDCERLGADAQAVDIEATADERRALAERLDLLALDRLEAALTAQREPGKLIRIHGRMRASVTQSCVVTLQPVQDEIDEPVEMVYTEDPASLAEDEVDLSVDEAFWPEPVEHGGVDLGEAIAQQLALALDPYPRAPGAKVDPAYAPSAPEGEVETHRPFRDLAERIRRESGG